MSLSNNFTDIYLCYRFNKYQEFKCKKFRNYEEADKYFHDNIKVNKVDNVNNVDNVDNVDKVDNMNNKESSNTDLIQSTMFPVCKFMPQFMKNMNIQTKLSKHFTKMIIVE